MSLFHVKTDINVLLSEIFYEQHKLAQSRQINYQLTLPRISLTTVVNNNLFQEVFTELIRHALEHAQAHVEVALLSFRSDDQYFHIAIRADGASIWPQSLADQFGHGKVVADDELPSAASESRSWSISNRYQQYLAYINMHGLMQSITVAIPIPPEDRCKPGVEFLSGGGWFKSSMHETEARNKPLLLLVVHDKQLLAHLLKELKANYRVLCAQHGKEALDLLAKHEVELLLTEYALPIMNGISLCRKIKANASYSHIPVVFLVEQHATTYKMQGLLSGADAYVEKPFSAILLAAQIDNLLANRKMMHSYVSNSLRTNSVDGREQTGDSDFMKRLQLVMYTYVSEIDLTIDEVAKRMNMSRPTLFRKVKKYSAMTPNELIHITKLNKAAELLAQRRYNITQVANMVGYSGQSNFSRDFHKHFGTPPSIYSVGAGKQHDVA